MELDGMELDWSLKQHFPQADPPLPAALERDRGTQNHLTHAYHQQHLSAAGDHSQTLLTGFTAVTQISKVFLWSKNKCINLDI